MEFNEANLLKRLKDLPGGGLGAGSALEVSDQAQQLSFRLVLEHEASWDEDVTPERWEIRGDLPAKAAEEAEAGSDDDVVEVAEAALDDAPASPSSAVADHDGVAGRLAIVPMCTALGLAAVCGMHARFRIQ